MDTSVGYSIHMGSMFANIEDFKNVEKYYNNIKNREAFLKALPKKISDPLENIEE